MCRRHVVKSGKIWADAYYNCWLQWWWCYRNWYMTSFEAKILVPFKLTEKYRQPIQTMHIFSQLDHCILIFTSSSITQPILIDLLQVSHFTGSQWKVTSLIFGQIFGKRLRRVQIKVYFIENFCSNLESGYIAMYWVVRQCMYIPLTLRYPFSLGKSLVIWDVQPNTSTVQCTDRIHPDLRQCMVFNH